MDTVYQILALLGAAMIIYVLYTTVKNKPELFSRENLSKSSVTMGILAIGLIVFVALLVLMVRNT